MKSLPYRVSETDDQGSSPILTAVCERTRCPLPESDALFRRYHDEEWGRPVVDDNRIFEKVCLEAFQSGLSWRTILHKREAFREAFDNFEIETVAGYGQPKIECLMKDDRIVKNRRKIEACINNASRALELKSEAGTLAAFFWSFEPEGSERPTLVTVDWLRGNTTTPASIALAKALKSRGWSFVGPTTMYALMQALGLVNDHVEQCCVRADIEDRRARFTRPERP